MIRVVMRSWMAVVLCAVGAWAMASPLNGNWIVDPSASQTLAEASAAENDRLKQEYLRGKKQKFAKDERPPSGTSRFRAQQDATERMIREEDVGIEWGGPPETRQMIEASSLKLYQANKAVILYDGTRRRLLAINPAGRAYSVSGTEMTSDEIGRSLTYVEDGALVVETDIYNGDKLAERFALGADPDTLEVTIRLKDGNRRPWLEYQRVFRRAD